MWVQLISQSFITNVPGDLSDPGAGYPCCGFDRITSDIGGPIDLYVQGCGG